MRSKVLPIKCPHCKKDIHTLETVVLVNIKRHLSDVKAEMKLLNYLIKCNQGVHKSRIP